MKKLISLALTLLCLPVLSGCQMAVVLLMGLFMGTFYVTDPAEYGKEESYIKEELGYFPESVEEYTVNAYAYTRYEYMDLCYEVFLDLTVSEAQLEELLAQTRARGGSYEQAAYYAEGYYEIVFSDDYEACGEENVGWATIDKVIYNAESLNVIFESFHAHDSGVYELKDVSYFNRFGIDQYEYAEKTTAGEARLFSGAKPLVILERSEESQMGAKCTPRYSESV